MGKRGKSTLSRQDIAEIGHSIRKTTATTTEKILEDFEKLHDAVLRTHERALTGKRLQQHVWKIWGHVRENKNSLESDKACRVVTEIIEGAIAEVQERLEQAVSDKRELSAVITILRKDLRELRNELEELKTETDGTAEEDHGPESPSDAEEAPAKGRGTAKAGG